MSLCCWHWHWHWILAASLATSTAGQAETMVAVPAGPFLRGTAIEKVKKGKQGKQALVGDEAGEADERPDRRITLSAFLIDRTEDTVAAYRACSDAGICRELPDAGASSADLPVVGVTWRDAALYCAYRDKRLPTEAEWEKAARGAGGLRYPWGDTFACDRGNFGSFQGEGRCAEKGAPGRPVPVGSYPAGASPYGALDMAGNVWEWVADRYAPRYYEQAPLTDPKGPARAKSQPGHEQRVLRGGGCCSIFGLPRTTDRLALPADYKDTDIGFRCAR